jgi:hypothetical protein
MAQRRKKKPAAAHRDEMSKTAIEHTYATMCKVLQAYGLDPNLLRSFSKQQRRVLCYLKADPPRFKVAEGQRVPGRLVDFVSESTHRFMRTHYFGDERIGLTYLELATYGMALYVIAATAHDMPVFQGEPLKTLNFLADFFKNDRIYNDLRAIGTHIRKTTMMISKVNFRIYGYTWKINFLNPGQKDCLRSVVYLSSEEPKLVHFTYNHKERIAFRVRAGRVISEPPHDATIDRWFITHEDDDPPVYLGIYIQSHALQRAKERMDIFPAHKRNYYVMEPLLYMHRVAYDTAGRPMLECYTKDGETIVRLGYFPFVIQKNKLFVLSFLPLISSHTWEGRHMQRQLGLQRDDLTFLGMDRLSFFLTVDFEQIPLLKEALIATKLWPLVTCAAKNPDMNLPIDQKKTQMIKKFFEQKAEYEKTEEQPPIDDEPD